jgi:3-methyladenine DNA glycosylase AlkD
MSKLSTAKKELRRYASKEKSRGLQRFFKTGKGEYAQGDIFIGVMVPFIRKVAQQFKDMPLNDTVKLLRSRIHEQRLLALFILVGQFNKGDAKAKDKIFKAYLANTKYINNWDLVDLSAPNIVGAFLLDKDRKLLYKLAQSRLLWERRIAVLATFAFIRQHQFGDVLRIAEVLLHDEHDLIHKAVGWMLREVGKRDKGVEELFLNNHAKIMPRTMLRYAIERFPENKRRKFLGLG